MNKVKRILKFAMRMEKDAYDFYSYYKDLVKTSAAQKVLSELSQIEKSHYELIKSKYDALGGDEAPITISWVVDNHFAAKDPHILADNSDTLIGADDDIPDLTVLRMAYLIENDFTEFYAQAAKEIDDPDAKQFLLELVQWEGRHRDLFYIQYQSLLKKNWSDILSLIFSK